MLDCVHGVAQACRARLWRVAPYCLPSKPAPNRALALVLCPLVCCTSIGKPVLASGATWRGALAWRFFLRGCSATWVPRRLDPTEAFSAAVLATVAPASSFATCLCPPAAAVASVFLRASARAFGLGRGIATRESFGGAMPPVVSPAPSWRLATIVATGVSLPVEGSAVIAAASEAGAAALC